MSVFRGTVRCVSDCYQIITISQAIIVSPRARRPSHSFTVKHKRQKKLLNCVFSALSVSRGTSETGQATLFGIEVREGIMTRCEVHSGNRTWKKVGSLLLTCTNDSIDIERSKSLEHESRIAKIKRSLRNQHSIDVSNPDRNGFMKLKVSEVSIYFLQKAISESQSESSEW